MRSQKFDRAATGGLQEHHTRRSNWNAPYVGAIHQWEAV